MASVPLSLSYFACLSFHLFPVAPVDSRWVVGGAAAVLYRSDLTYAKHAAYHSSTGSLFDSFVSVSILRSLSVTFFPFELSGWSPELLGLLCNPFQITRNASVPPPPQFFFGFSVGAGTLRVCE